MVLRPFTTDKPQRESYGRSVVIRARIDASNYLVDTGDGMPEMAYFSGAVLLVPSQRVSALWSPEGFMWIIRGPDALEDPVVAGTEQAGTEVPVDGSDA